MYSEEERLNDIERIRELETELLKLRLRSRHFDFANDYNRNYAQSPSVRQDELEKLILKFMETLDEPIENRELIHRLVTQVLDLTEFDLEKTNSGNIRIFSAIRTAVVHLQDADKIAKGRKCDIKRGHLILVENYQRWLNRNVAEPDLQTRRLRDHFPETKDEASEFDVIIYDEVTVFKVFELHEKLVGEQLLGEVVDRINEFLTKNGYSKIPINEIDMEEGPRYDSPDGLYSLSKHGYCDDLVLFIKKYNY
jgi:hypothetical protein